MVSPSYTWRSMVHAYDLDALGHDTLAASTLDGLTDVVITSPAAGQRLRYTGSSWVNSSLHWQVLFDYTGSALLSGTGDPIEIEVL